MGLMLSILVICVGVIEALSCYEHFQYGVIHYATNIYESSRRTSFFLSYTSRKLGLLAKESALELDGMHGKSFKPFRSLDECISITEEDNLSNGAPYRCKPVEKSTVINRTDKKLEKQDKIDIVKKHFARPVRRNSKPLRSLSMPELSHTEEDIELSKIINDLAIEPIEEVDVEIETSNPETLEKQFEELFCKYQNPTLSNVGNEKFELENINFSLNVNETKVELNLGDKNKSEFLELSNLNASSNDYKSKKDIDAFSGLKQKFSEVESRSKSFSSKRSDQKSVLNDISDKESLVKQYMSQKPEKRQVKRSISAVENRINFMAAENISSPSTGQISDLPKLSFTSDIPVNKSFDFDKPNSLTKFADVILENETPTNVSVEIIDKTFEELYGDLNDESLNVINIYEGTEENIVNELQGKEGKVENIDVKLKKSQISVTNFGSLSEHIFNENISQTILTKAIDQLADLIVKDCLKAVKNFCLEQLPKSNILSKKEANDDKDTANWLELKLENRSMEKSNFLPSTSGIMKNVQPEISNSGILESVEKELIESCSSQFSSFKKDHSENPIVDYSSLDCTALVGPKFSDKLGYGISIDSEEDFIRPELINNISKVAEASFSHTLDFSHPGEKNSQESQQLQDFDSKNGLTKNISNLGFCDKNDEKTKLFIREKTPLLAIKDQDIPCLEYKKMKNQNTQELKKEIIPMKWQTNISEESTIAGNSSRASETLLETASKNLDISFSEKESSLKSPLTWSVNQNREKKDTGKIELQNEVSEIFAVESNLNLGSSDVIAVLPNTDFQNLERGIFQSSHKSDSDIERQMQVEKTDSISPPTIAEKTKSDDVTAGLHTLNNKLLAIEDKIFLPLEYKNDKDDTNQKNKKELPLEWKTNIQNETLNFENSQLVNEENFVVMNAELSLNHRKSDERENNLEKPILNSKKILDIVSPETLAADLDFETTLESHTCNDFETKVSSENILIQNTKHHTSPDVQKDDLTNGDISKPNFYNSSVISKPKPNSESFQSLSPENDSQRETIDTIEIGARNETISEIKNLVESEKEDNSELLNDSKNLNARNNNREVKDTNSAPEAFWLIFSGEYTKAMSKDWHSGHFSCWQCDEALTGQRYVLRDDHPYCIKCYESVFANVCEECNKIIGIDSKDLSYKDKHWHEACFLCNKCRVSLVDKQFGSKADKIYCGNCYDAQFASRCDGCGEIFRAGTKKMEYKTRQWHEKCFCCCVCKTPIGTKSFIPREQEIYCATCYEEKFATRCVKCNKIITSGGVTYKNEPWHRECFTCTNCNTSLAGQRFTSRDEKPYCADCFGELFAKRCTACSRPITGIGGTRFISFEDRHWHNDCFICASCKTSLVGRGFITDGDDIICPECAKQKLM